MDRSLNTAESGYLFLRLINAAQSVMVTQEDCGTQEYLLITETDSRAEGLPDYPSRLIGRVLAKALPSLDFLTEGSELDEDRVDRLLHTGVQEIAVRTVLGCQARRGVCRACYGHDLSTRSLVCLGVAVGIIAAQSIGEPSTQLTMRTFHTGGVAGVSDITQGLPRVEELFEARRPKDAAILSEIDGTVAITKKKDGYTVRVVSSLVGRAWSSSLQTEEEALDARMQVFLDGAENMRIGSSDLEVRSYSIPLTRKLAVSHGQQIAVGTPLTTGPRDPREVLRLVGKEAVQQYLVNEVRRVYRMTGVSIHEKHFEVIVREMLRHVQVKEPGDTKLLPGDIVDRFQYTDFNAHVLAEGGEPATAKTLLLGLTRTALASESWLAAASFQEATRVLTDAVLKGKIDHLQTLKQHVMIGRLIPAGTGFRPQQ